MSDFFRLNRRFFVETPREAGNLRNKLLSCFLEFLCGGIHGTCLDFPER